MWCRASSVRRTSPSARSSSSSVSRGGGGVSFRSGGRETTKYRSVSKHREILANRSELLIESVKKQLAENDLRRAYVNLNRAASLNSDNSQLRGLAQQLKELTQEQLVIADSYHEQGQCEQALTIYLDVAKMSKLDVAKEAKLKLDQTRKNPAYRSAMREFRAARMYEVVDSLLLASPQNSQESKTISVAAESVTTERTDLQRAMGLDFEPRMRLVLRLAKIVKRYGDTSSGQRAADLHEQLLTDIEFAAELDRHHREAGARKQLDQALLSGQPQESVKTTRGNRRLAAISRRGRRKLALAPARKR